MTFHVEIHRFIHWRTKVLYPSLCFTQVTVLWQLIVNQKENIICSNCYRIQEIKIS